MKKKKLEKLAATAAPEAKEPKNFLKWYEDGDFAPVAFTESEKEMISRSESPLFAAMFVPRAVTFSVEC